MERRVTVGGIKRLVGVLFLLSPVVFLFAGSVFSQSVNTDSVVVLGYNELGMHCMNEDFSELTILPPYNTLRAQVIDRSGSEPRILTSGISLKYTIPGNTHSADKTNFWLYAEKLFGLKLLPNIGLTGNGLAGAMTATARNDWEVSGIPLTPLNDMGRDDPYQLATITAYRQGVAVGQTRAVVPVSWEISCNLCHNPPGISTATDILRKHDRLHATNLEQQKPVLCGSCHADPALGTPGSPGVLTLSRAMHGAHASRMEQAGLQNSCYACHPGIRAQCQRDVHLSKGMTCTSCHGSMESVAAANRRPWVDEPRCTDCHRRAGFEFEQANTLYKDSIGHQRVHCAACHGSPHAITPTATAADNLQSIAWQGAAGQINQCTVCHRTAPNESFPHRRSD